ncbi:MAG TPA: hypothetical protein VII35_13810 [Steroidobacteraceae bacterium]
MPDLDRITATSEQALDALFNVGLVNLNRQPHALLGGNKNNVSQVGEMNKPVKGRDRA